MRSQKIIPRALIVTVLAIATSFGSLTYTFAAPFPGALGWDLRADLPGGVHSAAGGVIDGVLYVSHGSRGANSAVLSAYDPAVDLWSVGPSASLARSGLGGAVLDGKLYAIGGTPGPTGAVEVFDPAINAWSAGASLGVPRAGVGAVALDGILYAIGGRRGSTLGGGTILDKVEGYAPSTGWVSLAPLPFPVSDTAAVALGGKVYAAGGAVSGTHMSNRLQIYDPILDQWSLGATMLHPRAAAAIGVLCGQIVAIGGVTGELGSIPFTDLYDPADDTWSAGPDMLVPAAGMAHGPTQTDDTIYAVGMLPFSLASVAVQALVAACDPTPTPTATVTPTALPTEHPAPTRTATRTETRATATPARTATASRTETPRRTATPRPTATATPIPNRNPECGRAFPDRAILRPANQALVPVSILNVRDPDGDPLTITVTRITQDEPLDFRFGDGDTCPDATGVGTSTPRLRAERIRWLDGRVYHLRFTADDGHGGRCNGRVEVCVPGVWFPSFCFDEGQRTDSTGPCN